MRTSAFTHTFSLGTSFVCSDAFASIFSVAVMGIFTWTAKSAIKGRISNKMITEKPCMWSPASRPFIFKANPESIRCRTSGRNCYTFISMPQYDYWKKELRQRHTNANTFETNKNEDLVSTPSLSPSRTGHGDLINSKTEIVTIEALIYNSAKVDVRHWTSSWLWQTRFLQKLEGKLEVGWNACRSSGGRGAVQKLLTIWSHCSTHSQVPPLCEREVGGIESTSHSGAVKCWNWCYREASIHLPSQTKISN